MDDDDEDDGGGGEEDVSESVADVDDGSGDFVSMPVI